MSASGVNQFDPPSVLKPIPYKMSPFPNLVALAKKVVIVATFIGLGSFLGLSIALGGWEFSIGLLSVLGGLIGLVVGVFYSSHIALPNSSEAYRIKTLDQVYQVTMSPSIRKLIQELKSFLLHPLDKVNHQADCVRIHRLLASIGTALDPQYPGLGQVWETFLNHLDGEEVTAPDGTRIVLEMDLQIFQLQGKTKVPTFGEFKGIQGHFAQEDLDQILKVRRLRYGLGQLDSEQICRDSLSSKDPNALCLVARGDEDEVIGYVWAVRSDRGLELKEIGYLPKTVILGVESNLLEQILGQVKEGEKIFSQIRRSDPLAGPLLRNGFTVGEDEPTFFCGPQEDAIYLELG